MTMFIPSIKRESGKISLSNSGIILLASATILLILSLITYLDTFDKEERSNSMDRRVTGHSRITIFSKV